MLYSVMKEVDLGADLTAAPYRNTGLGQVFAALPRDARTAEQPADVARRYRVQAESLDGKAAEQEKLAAQQAAHGPGIVHKWPSMAPRTLTDTKQKALDYRRAARESREHSDRHRALAVEARAD